MDTPSENTFLWQLPKVSSAFHSRTEHGGSFEEDVFIHYFAVGSQNFIKETGVLFSGPVVTLKNVTCKWDLPRRNHYHCSLVCRTPVCKQTHMLLSAHN